ncbi:MAG: SH3 domain-containing protein [Deltaproteobacteria bacterium]|nr:SH3 domain-containing protein [Deltaproteobacteria bacterium]
MQVWVLLLALLILGMPGHAAMQTSKLYPVDEGPKDRSFKLFRERLLEAARKRNEEFILSILHPDIESSFGGHKGIQDFKDIWQIDQANTKLWQTLITVLSMGGSFRNIEGKRHFCAPYVSSRWPDEFDAYYYWAIIGKNVRARERPSVAAAVVAILSYDIVKVDPDQFAGNRQMMSNDWIKILTANGKEAYVSSKYIRNPIGYRACFKKVKGRWLMTALLAGD